MLGGGGILFYFRFQFLSALGCVSILLSHQALALIFKFLSAPLVTIFHLFDLRTD